MAAGLWDMACSRMDRIYIASFCGAVATATALVMAWSLAFVNQPPL